ncbi:MAG: GldM family protein [Flavobacteriaceae bacterium]
MKKIIYISALLTLLFLSSCQDKKVIAAFGYMNEKLEESNQVLSLRNGIHKQVLDATILEHPKKYASISERSEKVNFIITDFYNYLEDVKDEIYDAHYKKGEKRTGYEKLSTSDFIDKYFFANNKPNKKGLEFKNTIDKFKIDISNALGRGFSTISSIVNARFRTDNIKNKKGEETEWLNLKFQNYPAITSITNISQMQTDVSLIHSELLLSMISGEFVRELAMRNFIGIVRLNKNAYLEGEVVTGKILLGRFDTSATPENVIVNGVKVDEKFLREGEVRLNFRAGSVGEHPLAGVFTIMEEGQPVQIRFNSSYSVIRQFQFDGQNPENPGIITKTTTSTKTPVPVAKPTSKPVTAFDETKVRLEGSIRDEIGHVKMSKRAISNSTIGAKHYETNKQYKVVSFSIQINGASNVRVKGNKMTSKAKKAINKTRKGQRIKIYDIKVISSSGGRLSNIEPIVIKIK